MEPALLTGRMAGVFQAEGWQLALQHLQDASVGCLSRALCDVARTLAHIQVIHANAGVGCRLPRQVAVVHGKAAPSVVDGDDHASVVEHRNVGGHRIQNAGLERFALEKFSLTLAQNMQQLVEATDQLTNFVLTGHG